MRECRQTAIPLQPSPAQSVNPSPGPSAQPVNQSPGQSVKNCPARLFQRNRLWIYDPFVFRRLQPRPAPRPARVSFFRKNLGFGIDGLPAYGHNQKPSCSPECFWLTLWDVSDMNCNTRKETFEPDYQNLLQVLCNQRPQRLPLYEHHIDLPFICKVLGRDLAPQSEKKKDYIAHYREVIAFWREMTYDGFDYGGD